MPLKIETLTLNDSVEQYVNKSIVPEAQQICDDVVLLWKEEPSTEDLEIDGLFERIILRHPEWRITQHTLLHTLTKHNLYATDEAELETYCSQVELPNVSEVLKDLGLPKNIELRAAGNGRGRGLFAKHEIQQGELISAESMPLVTIPPIEKLTLMQAGKVCSLCGNSLGHSDHFIMMNGLDCNGCRSVWCNRNCKKRDLTHAALKHVKARNQAISGSGWAKFEKFCMDNVFVAAYSVGIIYASSLVGKDDILKRFAPLAQVSQRLRNRVSDSTNVGGTFDASSGAVGTSDPEPIWERAYELFKEAFPKSAEIDLDKFLIYVGKFNLNQVAGQIYPLYAFINHDCEPNVRYEIDDKLRLKVYARKIIKAGDELFTTYVNPLHGVKLRRRELRVNWGFLCQCNRCNKELSQRTVKMRAAQFSLPSHSFADQSRRRSSMRNARPDLTDLLKNGQEFDLEIPDNVGISHRRRTSVRFDNNVTVAVEE
ncbi:hypothetical protein HG536_0C06490 [Torulaspora globosa]|uniref:Histone-lysine N-methyltransferase SET5 n=1 Tax=Torulaspora globosa TaxID=48254 RepID=A0A7G3ZG44_9SACH|nr:uncharacterized protein HG536_0C06490 [Torulaspora globosa]QLL32480.1 hypothetical protein HG536_0C06490 [Torulaspora globosa]